MDRFVRHTVICVDARFRGHDRLMKKGGNDSNLSFPRKRESIYRCVAHFMDAHFRGHDRLKDMTALCSRRSNKNPVRLFTERDFCFLLRRNNLRNLTSALNLRHQRNHKITSSTASSSHRRGPGLSGRRSKSPRQAVSRRMSLPEFDQPEQHRRTV